MYFAYKSKKLKETCEICGCTPHAPRRRCKQCDYLVCVSKCWNKKVKLCCDCSKLNVVIKKVDKEELKSDRNYEVEYIREQMAKTSNYSTACKCGRTPTLRAYSEGFRYYCLFCDSAGKVIGSI